jgi:hypothetical protein
MKTPHGYLKQRRSKLKGAQALGHMAQQSGCWHEVSRSALDMDPGPNRGTRRWSCGLRAVGTWTEKGGNGNRTSNGDRRAWREGWWSPMCICICTGGRPPSRQAGGFALHPGLWLDSSHPHPTHRAAPATLARNRSFSTVQWKPCGPSISSASAGQSGLGWGRLSPRPASYPWLIARSRAGQSGAACADRKVGKSWAGNAEKSRIPTWDEKPRRGPQRGETADRGKGAIGSPTLAEFIFLASRSGVAV